MDRAARRAGEAAFRHQEIAFSVVMAAVAFLLRDSPANSPGLLAGFAVLLAFNLGYQVLLRRRGDAWAVPLVSMAVNAVLVTFILHSSGGAASPFWPMYLVPIFTACLYLQGRHVAFAAAASAAFLASQYLLAADVGSPWAWALAEWTLKAGVLSLSALATAGHAFQERAARRELAGVRAEMDALAAELESAGSERRAARDGLSRFMAGLVYDLHGRLALIRGRADLLSSALAPDSASAQDARGIADAARALGRLSTDLLRVLRDDDDAETVEPDRLIAPVLHLIEFRLHMNRLRLEYFLPEGLPRVRVGVPHFQQALLELLETASSETVPEGRIAVSAEVRGDAVCLRLRYDAPGGEPPPPPLPQRRLLEGFGARVETRADAVTREYAVLLPVAQPAGRPAR